MHVSDAIVEILNELDETPLNDEIDHMYGRLGEDVLEVLELLTEDDEDEAIGLLHVVVLAHTASTMNFRLSRESVSYSTGSEAVEDFVTKVLGFFWPTSD